MPDRLVIDFALLSAPLEAAAAVLSAQDRALAPAARDLDARSGGALLRAAEAADFKGKAKTAIELLAPSQLDLQRLLLIGAGQPSQYKTLDWLNLGGFAFSQLAERTATVASLVAEVAG